MMCFDEVSEHMWTGKTPPEANDAWISSDAVAAKAKAKSKRAAEPDEPLLPKVIRYDGRAAAPVYVQDTRWGMGGHKEV